VGWLTALVLIAGVSQTAGTDFRNRFSLPGTESQRAIDLLKKNFPAQSGETDTIVLHARTGTVRDPDVMLIDEVIGVGDLRFFTKAFARLRSVVERSSILFVASHADDILRQLCNKAIWLQNGTLMAYGEISEVIAAYRGAAADPHPQQAAADPAIAAPVARV